MLASASSMVRRALTVIVLLIAIPQTVLADPGTDIAAGQSIATVVHPLSAIAVQDLSFGAVVVDQFQGGEVRISADGPPVRYTGSVRASCSGNSDCMPHAALFAVTGEADRAYRIALPASVLAQGSKTGYQLLVEGLAASSSNHPGLLNAGSLDADGLDHFTVGGRLVVPAGARPDTFRADLPVTVHYF